MAKRVVRVRAHAVGQRLDAAQREPAIERRGNRSAKRLRAAAALKQIVIVARDEHAANYIAVAADVFGGRVSHHVDAAFERPLQNGCGERAIADRDRLGLARDLSDGGQVGDLHERVRRRFEPDQARVGTERGAHRIHRRHINIGGFQSPLTEHAADHLAQRPVDIVRRQNVVAGFEALDHGGGHGQSRGKHQRLFAALQIGQALFQHGAVRVAVAGIAEAARVGAFRAAFKRGGEVDGRRHRAGGGVDVASRMDRPGLDLHQCLV